MSDPKKPLTTDQKVDLLIQNLGLIAGDNMDRFSRMWQLHFLLLAFVKRLHPDERRVVAAEAMQGIREAIEVANLNEERGWAQMLGARLEELQALHDGRPLAKPRVH